VSAAPSNAAQYTLNDGKLYHSLRQWGPHPPHAIVLFHPTAFGMTGATHHRLEQGLLPAVVARLRATAELNEQDLEKSPTRAASTQEEHHLLPSPDNHSDIIGSAIRCNTE
jgi:hypothetical protein